MKKADLVDLVAQQRGLPRPQVEATVDSLIDAIAEGLAKGERIDLRGFGAFAVRESAARSGRNPQTAETIQIPPPRATPPTRRDDSDRRAPRSDVQGRQGIARPREPSRNLNPHPHRSRNHP